MKLECLAPDNSDFAPASPQIKRRRGIQKVAKAATVSGKKSHRVAKGSGEGVVTLSRQEYARFERCMMNPEPPSEAILQGADLLRRLRNKSL